MNDLIFSPIPLEDLLAPIRQLEEEVRRLVTNLTPPKPDDELLTIKDACDFLKVSKVSLHKWKREGKIEYHRFGSRIRFKKSELLALSRPKKKGNK